MRGRSGTPNFGGPISADQCRSAFPIREWPFILSFLGTSACCAQSLRSNQRKRAISTSCCSTGRVKGRTLVSVRTRTQPALWHTLALQQSAKNNDSLRFKARPPVTTPVRESAVQCRQVLPVSRNQALLIRLRRVIAGSTNLMMDKNSEIPCTIHLTTCTAVL